MDKTQPSQQEIDQLLFQLNHELDYQRTFAIQSIQEQRITDERIISTLKTLAAQDKLQSVRGAARAALISLGTSPPPVNVQPLPPSNKSWLFFGGLLGWYLLNALIWLIIGLSSSTLYSPDLFATIFIFPVNIMVLLSLSVIKRTRMLALGMIAALASNLLLSLFNGVITNGICFIPFYLK